MLRPEQRSEIPWEPLSKTPSGPPKEITYDPKDPGTRTVTATMRQTLSEVLHTIIVCKLFSYPVLPIVSSSIVNFHL